jgi:hypothetical protein
LEVRSNRGFFQYFYERVSGLIKGLVTYFNLALNHGDFYSPSKERDAKIDSARIDAIVTAIENALNAAQSEHSGLSLLVDDVLARASVTLGNGTDEYLEREASENYHQELFAAKISNGQRRLKELAIAIAHFEFMKATVLSRFSNCTWPSPCAMPSKDLEVQD